MRRRSPVERRRIVFVGVEGESERAFARFLQSPNLEGLLLRLHPGCERRNITAGDALAALRRVWPGYAKPATTDQLHRRFKLSDLRRAARHDKELRGLLAVLGLS